MNIRDMMPADRHNAMVEFLLDFADSLDDDELDDFDPLPAIAERFPGVSGKEVVAALSDLQQRLQERVAEADATADAIVQLMPLFDGLPEGTQLREAVAAKAAAGDVFAQHLLDNPHLLPAELSIYPDDDGAGP